MRKKPLTEIDGYKLSPGKPELCPCNGGELDEMGFRIDCYCDDCGNFKTCYPHPVPIEEYFGRIK